MKNDYQHYYWDNDEIFIKKYLLQIQYFLKNDDK